MKTVYVRTKTKDEARKRAEWLYMILRDCTPVIADLHTSKAQVVTESMVIKYVPENYTMDGIRCDIAIGFGQLGKIIARENISDAAIVKGAGYRLKNEKLKNVSTACYTGNLRAALKAAGFKVLTDKKYLTSDAYLLEGDILLNDGAHVATNLTNGAKASGGGASQTVPINSNVKLETAKGFNKSLAGTYKVTGAGALNLRSGAGTGKDKKVFTTMQSGETCQCYGYYTDVSGVKWLYVAYKNVVGFASSKYLKK